MSGEFGDLLVVVGVILLLVLCSAFFSSAETALTAASHARIRELASRGNKRAKLVEKLRSDQEGLIGSILIGNNAVNVVASALATTLFLDLFGEAGLLWATLVMTVMLVVFAEVMPKTYALNHSDKYALAIALPLRLVVIVLHPALHRIALHRRQDSWHGPHDGRRPRGGASRADPAIRRGRHRG